MKMNSLKDVPFHKDLMRMQPMNLFPAIVVGGPPHSGKSVLTYSLSMALRKRNVAHYALRAAPDGEGDWTNETDWPVVERIRRKGQWTSRWVSEVCKAISQRHLPLLVDMGGRPTPEQEAIFDQCNYAILLTPSEEQRSVWLAHSHLHNLTVIADLHTDLHSQNQLVEGSDPIAGTLTGLNRGCEASGPAFDGLVERVAAIMHFSSAELWQSHRKIATWIKHTHVLNFDEQTKSEMNAHGTPIFSDADIDKILMDIPKGQSVCLYGRAPATAYAAIGHRNPVEWLFDVRLGWVSPPMLQLVRKQYAPRKRAPISYTVEQAPKANKPHRCVLHADIASPPLDIVEAVSVTLPRLPASSNVVIDGIIPNWLLVAIAHAYRYCASVSANRPQQQPVCKADKTQLLN
jgi:CRISPR-associated protein Csx3